MLLTSVGPISIFSVYEHRESQPIYLSIYKFFKRIKHVMLSYFIGKKQNSETSACITG